MSSPSQILNELLYITQSMAQELQEFIDAGQESGSNMDATKLLLDDFEKIYPQAAMLTNLLS